jgi:hypothetical protein
MIMEKQLEHKIKEAFQKQDESFDYEKKDELWNRISGHVSRAKVVPAFWRVAAVILALIAFGVAFAAISISQSQSKKIVEVNYQNLKLKNIIDSLQSVNPEKIVETQYIEKEKIVYRKIEQLSDENETADIEIKSFEKEILNLNEILKNTSSELQFTRDSLKIAFANIEKLMNRNINEPDYKGPNFKLKTERVKDQLQTEQMESSPKMKVQLFKIQDSNMKFDMNSTLLKK